MWEWCLRALRKLERVSVMNSGDVVKCSSLTSIYHH